MASSTGAKTFVSVLWDDAWKASVDEGDIGESHRPARMETRGWLLRADDIGVTLADERCLDDDTAYRGRTFIPRAMIVSVTTFPIKRPSRAKTHLNIHASDVPDIAPGG